MSSIKFSERILVDNSPAVVFDFTQDYSRRLLWDTFLKKADLLEGAKAAGLGVKAWCVARNGLGMETEYVSFNRPKATAIKMTRGPYLFKSFLGSWTFKETGPGQTEIIFLYSFTLRFPFNLFKIAIKKNLSRNVRKRLNDLKKSLESH